MSERTRNFMVGLTTVAGLVGFVYLVFIFGEMPAWVTDTYRLTVTMNQTGGVTEGSRVRLNGVSVGHVAAVELHEDPHEGVILTCHIESQYEIPADAEVRTVAGLLGGAAQLHITTTPPSAIARADPLPRDDTAHIRGQASPDLMATTQRLEKSLQEQLENFGRVTDRLVMLSDQYIEVGERASALLEQRSPEQVDAGEAEANITTMLARADARLGELQQTIDQVNALVGDESLHEDIRQTVANTRLFTDDARRLTENAERHLDTLMRRFVAVADDLSRTLSSVDHIMEEARAGEGTLGRLMQDPSLYDNLQDATGRLSEALLEAQLLIEKWRVEGVPIQW